QQRQQFSALARRKKPAANHASSRIRKPFRRKPLFAPSMSPGIEWTIVVRTDLRTQTANPRHLKTDRRERYEFDHGPRRSQFRLAAMDRLLQALDASQRSRKAPFNRIAGIKCKEP